ANNARLRAGLRKIVACYDNGTALISLAMPKTATQDARRAVLQPEFRALVRSFSSLMEAAQANRSPGRSAFASPSPANSRRSGQELALVAHTPSPATPARRGNIVSRTPPTPPLYRWPVAWSPALYRRETPSCASSGS
ncbi:hypothetical protein C8A03DRAFT_16519, partial [Achaetomium macrosporum]